MARNRADVKADSRRPLAERLHTSFAKDSRTLHTHLHTFVA